MGTMSAPTFISVIVTTYNRSDALGAVLRGLAAQTDRGFEVLVADDGSNPTHCQALATNPDAHALGAWHVWHPDVGFTAGTARNRGVAASRGDYLVFLDGDCVPERDFIAQHRRLAQQGCLVNGSRALLSQALTQAVLAGAANVIGRGWGYWLRQRWRADVNKLAHCLRLPDGAWRVARRASLRGVRSCNLGVWRANFDAVDGFDESFVGWGHEDADLVLRLFHAGVRRKSGACATEVLHLWHPEAARAQESANWATVQARMRSPIVRAQCGYSRVRPHDQGQVQRL